MGLWILQECRREWGREAMDYAGIVCQAEQVGNLGIHIDVDDEIFLKPGTPENGMVARVQTSCRKTGQKVPRTPGEIARVIFESLTRRYAENLRMLRNLTGKKISCLHVIGGGCRNELLCKFTAAATGIPVHAGPVEATALGNILVQALACGEIASLEAGREIIRSAYPPTVFNPD